MRCSAAANFVANIVWEKDTGRRESTRHFSTAHDYVLIYAKDQDSGRKYATCSKGTESQIKRYTNPDNDPRGPWLPGDIWHCKKRRATVSSFDMTLPSGRKVVAAAEGGIGVFPRRHYENALGGGP